MWESLVSQLDLDLIERDPRISLLQMVGDITEEDLDVLKPRFSEWKISVEAHAASIALAEGPLPALPTNLYREVSEFIDEAFQKHSLSIRVVLWYSLCTGLIRASNELVEQQQMDKFFKESGLKDLIGKLKKPREKPKNPPNLN